VKYKNYFEKEINNVCHLCIVGYKKHGYQLMSTTNNFFCTTSLEITMIHLSNVAHKTKITTPFQI
jgi:hypothetical protein